MHELTLTLGERHAMDWIGGRYAHGNQLSMLLWCDEGSQIVNPDDQIESWDDDCDITFRLTPEAVRKAEALCREDDMACFADELRGKLTALFRQIAGV